MPDFQLTLDSRVDAALAAMREPPLVTGASASRAAARAVLAGVPVSPEPHWSWRIAAAITVVALGTAAFASSRLLPSRTPSAESVSMAALPTASFATISPVMSTAARPIVFEFDAPSARTVQVLGDFNQWSRSVTSMQRGLDGRWRLTTLLPPGRYVYAFLVDGRTFRRDPLRDAIEDHDFGVTGSELFVGEAP